MAVRILHAADFHMDSPFGALPEEKAAERRREQRELLNALADRAEEERADIVLLAGDLFDSDVAYWETQETLLGALAAIRAQVFIAPGNHDYYCAKSPYAFLSFPDNVHLFTTAAIRGVELPELGCRVFGAGFNASLCRPILPGFTAPDDGMINLMVLHGEMGGDKYAPLTEEDIAASGLDYLALGHVHAFSGIRKAGRTFWAYPGCIEGRGFDETGDKGVIAGTVDKGSCALRFVPMGGRRYHIEEVDMSGEQDALAALRRRAAGHERDIVRFILTGAWAGKADVGALTAALQDSFYSVSVKDRTVPTRDIWAGCGEDSLTGLFLARMRERYDAGDEADKALTEQAVRYALAALEGREGADV